MGNQKCHRTLGKDYVILQSPNVDYNGATVKDDHHVHLGIRALRSTACELAIENFMLTNREVEINCLDCVKELVRKSRT